MIVPRQGRRRRRFLHYNGGRCPDWLLVGRGGRKQRDQRVLWDRVVGAGGGAVRDVFISIV